MEIRDLDFANDASAMLSTVVEKFNQGFISQNDRRYDASVYVRPSLSTCPGDSHKVSGLITTAGPTAPLSCVAQVCHQAVGGCGFLRGRCHQQRSSGAGCGDEQSQPRAPEADERAEHPETGPTQQQRQACEAGRDNPPCSIVFADFRDPESTVQGAWRGGGASAPSGGAGRPEELPVPVHVQTLLQSVAALPGGLPQEPGEVEEEDDVIAPIELNETV